ncbi:MAG: DUF3892 domain-containing protein [Candidatus Peribacteraceae bacterium]|jgi:hypothetical protein|nr:DUF3892 domain-containing protein [Candidatus Peribacteraceae bacterium]MDP7454502.1 DUF3892 domain-containing protein [Candidatus Peribacteraceae bacterium]MDP7646286.1 DUF3892 domain-containing protein [Candidatus Peribacteraceae bacterium]|tara:strand:- start:48 stop:950 length:903 start_codon:yes stop_codon:yes gene_type:complete
MKITFVVTDIKGKNLVFSSDTLKTYSLDESVKLVKQNKIDSVHVVRAGAGSYLRTNPNTMEEDNLDYLSLSSYKLFASLDQSSLINSILGLRRYFRDYNRFLEESVKRIDDIIVIDGFRRTTKQRVVTKLKPHREIILKAANHFGIDSITLGAIIVDEIARMLPLEDIIEKILLCTINWNSSVGIAQVKLETARGLIRIGYYNPNPNDSKLSQKYINKTPKEYLYNYVVKPKHSVFFAAARIREIIDQWMPVIDLSDRPEIIGTLYNQPPRKPRNNPGPTDRGSQIQQEFYPIAKTILRK